MRKIGLCICYSVKNYGSMLQAYATQQYIEKAGFDYEIIKYNKKHNLKFLIVSCFKLFNGNFRKEVFRRLTYKKELKLNPDLNKNLKIRNLKFEEFEKENFHNVSENCELYSQLLKKGNEFPAYLVGSDQLWLPAGLSTNFYNLNFASEKSVKISYATSFGVSKIPWYQKKRTAAYLHRIQFLSVREQKGIEIIKNIAHKDAKLVVDPTLLLTESDWNLFITPNRLINVDYIFVYFIGKNQEHRKAVQALKEKTGCTIVVLKHIDEYIPSDVDFGDIEMYDVGPAEFVNLIRYAKYVCTDSFHGSAFSIINKKNFIVFNRFGDKDKNSTNSRIDSLCSILNLNDRRFDKNQDIYVQMAKQIEYNRIENILVNLRKTSEDFLNKAFLAIEEC